MKSSAEKTVRVLCGSLASAIFVLSILFTPSAALAQKAVQVAAGAYSSVMLREDGTVWAWGGNGNGQLGDGTNASRATMGVVPKLVGVAQVAAGAQHSAAVTAGGTVMSWGSNYYGQLGDGSTDDRATPVSVVGLTGVTKLSTSFYHVLARKGDGSVWAWGNNIDGQLGDSTQTSRYSPVRVPGLSGVTAVAAGFYHSLALQSDGTVWAWGYNGDGQLGNGGTTSSTVPVQVPGLSGVISIAANYRQSLALKSDGTVWAWGDNLGGQLGDGTTDNRLSPTRVSTLSGITAISTGRFHSLAVRANGTLVAWGWNSDGQLGLGHGLNQFTPVDVPGLAVTSISANGWHSLAIKADGSAWAWGFNADGQLGDGSINMRTTPLAVDGLPGMTTLQAGWKHSVAVASDRTVWAWGNNADGQLGDNFTTYRPAPAKVPALSEAVYADAGAFHSLALRSDATVWAWGYNGDGQLGDGTTTTRAEPRQVVDLTGVATLAAGARHTLALKSDGTVWAWGNNADGQLGDGSTTQRSSPSRVQGLSGIVAIKAGGGQSLALRNDGTVWAWGNNVDGQLGDGTTIIRHTPVQVVGLTGITAIASGWYHSLALKNDGTVWAWGFNRHGQLGDGTTTSRSVPVRVGSLKGVTALAAGWLHSLAQTADRKVYGWGLGGPSGSLIDESVPAQLAFVRDIVKVAANSHSLALDGRGRVIAWGSNVWGQLGTAGPDASSIPKSVVDPLNPVHTRGASAVIEFFNDRIGQGHYFVTSSSQEALGIDAGAAGAGWARTGRSWRAWAVATDVPSGTNATPVYRFYARGPNSHFYTLDEGEKNFLVSQNPTLNVDIGWALEGVNFYAIAPIAADASVPVSMRDARGNTCPASYYPVFRAYNNRFAHNDSNHRITSNAVDILRGVRFFGWTDEGIAFCSPTSSADGGDLQAYHTFPGDQVATSDAIVSEHFFTNAGPGIVRNVTVRAALPQGLNWTVTCTATFGAACLNASQLANVDDLALGVTIAALPAGSTVKLTAKATAPTAPQTIDFGSSIDAPRASPDLLVANNMTSTSKTVALSAQQCTATLSTPSLSVAAEGTTGTTSHINLRAPANCSWAITAGEPWVRLSPASGIGSTTLTLNVDPNATTAHRQASLTAAANSNPNTKSETVLTQTAPPVIPECFTVQLGKSAEQLGPNTIQSSVSVIAQRCTWFVRTTQNWITVTGGATGLSTGTVSYQVQNNPDVASRKGQILIGDVRLDIIQAGTATLTGATTETGSGDGGGDGGGSSGGGDGGSSGGDSG